MRTQVNNPTTIPLYPRMTKPQANAEAMTEPTTDILPVLAIAGAVIAAKLAMLGLLIHAL
jgi:hypothetical protein